MDNIESYGKFPAFEQRNWWSYSTSSTFTDKYGNVIAYCDHCGELYDETNMQLDENDQYICPDCLADELVICDNCLRDTYRSNTAEKNGSIVCGRCLLELAQLTNWAVPFWILTNKRSGFLDPFGDGWICDLAGWNVFDFLFTRIDNCCYWKRSWQTRQKAVNYGHIKY